MAYSIYHNGRLLYDPQIDDLAITAPTLTLEGNKIGSLSFTIYPTHDEYGEIKKLTSNLSIYKDGRLFYKFRPSYSMRGFKNSIKFQCEEFIACLNDFKFRPFEFTGTISEFVSLVLDSYNERAESDRKIYAGNILVTDENDYVAYSSVDYLGHWEVLQSRLVKTHGGYFKARYTENGTYLDYLRPEDLDVSTQSIDFGVNMTDLFIETSSEETYSVLIPLGAQVTTFDEHGDEVQKRLTIESVNNGKDYIENAAGIALYGRRETSVTWDDVTIASNLYSKGKTHLDRIAVKFKETVNLTAVDLHNANANVETLNFLEWIPVNSTVHNISESYILGKIIIPLGNPDGSKISLGAEKRSLTDKIFADASDLKETIGNIEGKVDNLEIPEIPENIVTSVNVEYYLSESTTELIGGEWKDVAPEWVNGKYMWSRTKTTYTDGTINYSPATCIAGAKGENGKDGKDGLNGLQGSDGKDGIPGKDGKDGVSTYFHLKYSPVANPTADQMTEIPSEYIGTYVDSVLEDSDEPSKYTWAKWQGKDGENGIPGKNGEDGKTYYLHIAYANSADGVTDFSVTDSEDKSYIGQYQDENQADSNNPADYKWSRIKGKDGVTYYTWIKYADTPTSGISDLPEGKKYIGIAYNKTVAAESTNYSDYAWSQIQGENGVAGEDGKTYYTWIRYADDANGNGMSDTPTDKFYIGIAYNKTIPDESNIASDYNWSLFRGSDGVDGENGKDGTDGLGIKYVAEQYALTSSKTEAPAEDDWQDTCPTWESGKYIWTRTKITYTNDTVVYTEPYCDSSWEAVNDLENKVNIDFDEIKATLTENVESLEAVIGKTETSILLQVVEKYVGKSEFAEYQSTVGTQISQTQEAIEISASNLEKYVDTSTGDIRQYVNGVQTYMRYSTDGLVLGAVGSSFQTQITNTRISFKQDNEEVAYISNRKLYITEAQIKNRLLFGVGESELFAWVVTETGLGLKWIG